MKEGSGRGEVVRNPPSAPPCTTWLQRRATSAPPWRTQPRCPQLGMTGRDSSSAVTAAAEPSPHRRQTLLRNLRLAACAVHTSATTRRHPQHAKPHTSHTNARIRTQKRKTAFACHPSSPRPASRQITLKKVKRKRRRQRGRHAVHPLPSLPLPPPNIHRHRTHRTLHSVIQMLRNSLVRRGTRPALIFFLSLPPSPAPGDMGEPTSAGAPQPPPAWGGLSSTLASDSGGTETCLPRTPSSLAAVDGSTAASAGVAVRDDQPPRGEPPPPADAAAAAREWCSSGDSGAREDSDESAMRSRGEPGDAAIGGADDAEAMPGEPGMASEGVGGGGTRRAQRATWRRAPWAGGDTGRAVAAVGGDQGRRTKVRRRGKGAVECQNGATRQGAAARPAPSSSGEQAHTRARREQRARGSWEREDNNQHATGSTANENWRGGVRPKRRRAAHSLASVCRVAHTARRWRYLAR